jgi:hypothetical protein
MKKMERKLEARVRHVVVDKDGVFKGQDLSCNRTYLFDAEVGESEVIFTDNGFNCIASDCGQWIETNPGHTPRGSFPEGRCGRIR